MISEHGSSPRQPSLLLLSPSQQRKDFHSQHIDDRRRASAFSALALARRRRLGRLLCVPLS